MARMTRVIDKGVWFKSDFSSPALACVEVCHGDATVSIRDSKWSGQPGTGSERPVITISAPVWMAWLDELATTEEAVGCTEVSAVRDPSDGSVTLASTTVDGTALCFTAVEWEAFILGVRAGQFDRPSSAVPSTV